MLAVNELTVRDTVLFGGYCPHRQVGKVINGADREKFVTQTNLTIAIRELGSLAMSRHAKEQAPECPPEFKDPYFCSFFAARARSVGSTPLDEVRFCGREQDRYQPVKLCLKP